MWKMFVKMAIPVIHAAGEAYKGQDDNDTGRDDLIEVSLVYVADLLQAIVSDKPELPKAPAILQ